MTYFIYCTVVGACMGGCFVFVSWPHNRFLKFFAPHTRRCFWSFFSFWLVESEKEGERDSQIRSHTKQTQTNKQTNKHNYSTVYQRLTSRLIIIIIETLFVCLFLSFFDKEKDSFSLSLSLSLSLCVRGDRKKRNHNIIISIINLSNTNHVETVQWKTC